MVCERCSGLMISDRYLGLDGQRAMLRCANCGSMVDARIPIDQARSAILVRVVAEVTIN